MVDLFIGEDQNPITVRDFKTVNDVMMFGINFSFLIFLIDVKSRPKMIYKYNIVK